METSTIIFVLFFGALVCGVVGYAIGSCGNRGSQGAWLGFLLGPIGLIIIALLRPAALPAPPRAHRKCPFCAELILTEAKVCRYCQRDLPAVERSTAPLFTTSLGE